VDISSGGSSDKEKEMITKELAEELDRGTTLHSLIEKNSDGTPVRVRVNGKCRTWKTRPEEFKLPVKYGLYKCLYINEKNASEFVYVFALHGNSFRVPKDLKNTVKTKALVLLIVNGRAKIVIINENTGRLNTRKPSPEERVFLDSLDRWTV
tara:strand:- start:324 stop:779 length:456 start_codon:yes stop_codon:yes gene_type:complete